MSTVSAPDCSLQGCDPHVVRLDPLLDQSIAPAAIPQVLASGFVFTEGPMWRGSRFWFVDEEGDKVHAVDLTGQVSTLVDYKSGPYAKPPGTPTGAESGATTGPNAMATAPDGSVIAMQQYARDVVRLLEQPLNPELPVKQVPFFHSYEGKHLNSPNDLVFAPDGSFFFTDPNYGLKGREHDPGKELPFQAVFRVQNGQLHPVITNLATPNGVALAPDNCTLFVNNSGPDQRIVAYPLDASFTLGSARNIITFTGSEGEGVPDGLKTDSLGNIWTTGPGGIRILTSTGHVLGQIKLPQVANNLAWGGPAFQTLLICAHDHVYTLETLVAGTRPLFSR